MSHEEIHTGSKEMIEMKSDVDLYLLYLVAVMFGVTLGYVIWGS